MVAVGKDALKDFYERKYQSGTEVPKSSKQFAIALIPPGDGQRVLDVGCGTGVNSKAIKALGCRVTGLDISEAAIAQYVKAGMTGFVCDVETGLPPHEHKFDVIFCSEVLEHLIDPLSTLKRLQDVLVDDGQLILTVPNSAFWLYRVAAVLGYPCNELQHPKHLQFFSRRSLTRVMEQSGFADLKVSGRNMYAILPDWIPSFARGLAVGLGWTPEVRFTTKKRFWHFSTYSHFGTSLFADTLIVVARKGKR